MQPTSRQLFAGSDCSGWPIVEIAEIGRLGGAAGVECHHAYESAGEGAVLAAAGLVRDDRGVEPRPDLQPFAVVTVAEAQLGAVDIAASATGPSPSGIGAGSGKASLPSGQSPRQLMMVSTRPSLASWVTARKWNLCRL